MRVLRGRQERIRPVATTGNAICNAGPHDMLRHHPQVPEDHVAVH